MFLKSCKVVLRGENLLYKKRPPCWVVKKGKFQAEYAGGEMTNKQKLCARIACQGTRLQVTGLDRVLRLRLAR